VTHTTAQVEVHTTQQWRTAKMTQMSTKRGGVATKETEKRLQNTQKKHRKSNDEAMFRKSNLR
jgi:hypothetical protein